MKKHFRVSTALLAAVLLAGCGSISSKDGGYYATESPSAEGAYDTAAGAANSSIVPEELPDSTDETAQKIIYNADINMESTDFDAARDTLLAAVDDCGAWMEYSSLSGDAKDHDLRLLHSAGAGGKLPHVFGRRGRGGQCAGPQRDCREHHQQLH